MRAALPIGPGCERQVKVQHPRLTQRAIELHRVQQLAQLAHVVLEQEAAAAASTPGPITIDSEAFLASLSPDGEPRTSDEGANVGTATAAAPKKPSARDLEQQQRYREILRETLIVEAFKVLLKELQSLCLNVEVLSSDGATITMADNDDEDLERAAANLGINLSRNESASIDDLAN